MVTTDLSKFGYRELGIAADILESWIKCGLPDAFDYEGEVRISFNTKSGFVFLHNGIGDTVVLKDKLLEMWYSCPECDAEGFADDIDWDADRYLCGRCGDASFLKEWQKMDLDERVSLCEVCDVDISHAKILTRFPPGVKQYW